MNTNLNGTLVEFRNLFNQMSVGFDDYWMPREKGSNYPPYNLIEESKNTYRIEMAVAGFSKDSIEIFEEEGKLTIVGDRNEEDTSDEELWHYNGLAQRRFSRSFNLAPNVEVTEAKLENGILVVRFLKDENKNRKTIEIR